jgi:hypothetical protein
MTPHPCPNPHAGRKTRPSPRLSTAPCRDYLGPSGAPRQMIGSELAAGAGAGEEQCAKSSFHRRSTFLDSAAHCTPGLPPCKDDPPKSSPKTLFEKPRNTRNTRKTLPFPRIRRIPRFSTNSRLA